MLHSIFSELIILDDPKTVATEYSILPDSTDLFVVRSGFYVVSPMAINGQDHTILSDSFTILVEQIMTDLISSSTTTPPDNKQLTAYHKIYD